MEELKYHYKYPHPAVTADCVIFGFDGTKLNVLLVERGIEPFKGKWVYPEDSSGWTSRHWREPSVNWKRRRG